MALIRALVQTALKTGYLTIEAEEQLRHLLTTQYDLEDLNAFMTLQEAAMTDLVKQESRELRYINDVRNTAAREKTCSVVG